MSTTSQMFPTLRPVVDIETKRVHIMQHINQIYEDYQRQELQDNHVQDEQYLNRNVLLLGLPRSGKTTLIHILDDPQYVSEELSLLSLPEEVTELEFTINTPSSRLRLNVLEIPGTMIARTTDLSRINQLCVDHRLFNVHLICFCISFHTGIDEYVIQSLVRLVEHLGCEQVSPHLCLIVTRCESKDEAQREKLCNELRQDVYFSNITRYFGRGIHFSGALNRDDWKQASEALYHQFENVYNYRRNIFDLLESNVKSFDMRPQEPKLVSPTSTSISRDVRRSSNVHENSLLSASSLPVKLPVQSSSQLPIKPLIPLQTQIHQEFPESTFFLRNREKPPLARARLVKPTNGSSLINAKHLSSQQKRRMSQRSRFNIANMLKLLILCLCSIICFLICGFFFLFYVSPQSQSYIFDILTKISYWFFN